jgi:shikimate dehydrogenase
MSALYGLIGYPLTHSFSPAYFTKKFEAEGIDAVYQSFPLQSIEAFPALLQSYPYLRGLNVTIPYKTAVIPYLDTLTQEAQAIGAVNCIAIRNGIVIGHNTDVIGFEKSITPLLKPHHTRALLLGTGGAARAVAYVLDKLHIPYTQVSRKAVQGVITYNDVTAERLHTNRLIINATPIGMYPQTDVCPPIPYTALTDKHLLYDLVYNPAETLFLQLGKQHGATIKNGLDMLHLQAEAGWAWWHSGS